MNLKHQLYIFLLFLSTILFLVLTLNYLSYKNQYNKDLENFIDNEIRLHKKSILNSIQNRSNDFEDKLELFTSISKEIASFLKTDKNLNLKALKSALKSKYEIIDFEFDIYLISKDYKIYKTTYVKDLGLDLKNISDAKKLLDKSLDGNIYFSKFVNTDPVNLEYRLYSYAYLGNDSFIEVSFSNKSISDTSISSVIENLHSFNKLKLYRVFKNNDGYSYFDILKKIDTNKNDFYSSLKVYNIFSNNDILNAAINFKEFKSGSEDFLKIVLPLFDKNMIDDLGFENLVMELEIDLSKKREFIKEVENLFIFSFVVIVLALILIFIFINNRFTRPIESILKSIKESKKVDENILKYNNELSKIAKKYNILYDKFSEELELNESLLKENKKFIADTVHQIRTPLTNIMMNGEMIKKFKKDGSLDIFVEQIDASINMLSNSYEDLSYLITSNSFEYKEININLSEILKERIKFFETISKVNFKKIDSILDEDVFVKINQIELERVIDNNISNAIKYAIKDKHILIILKKIKNSASLEFRSFGNEILNKALIFNKNYREDEAKRGLGLGLFMVRNICKKYDIKYRVFYENGQNIFIYSFRLENIT